MKKPFSIVIAEDHKILREGLKSLLSSHPDVEVIGEAADGLEAIRCAQNLCPDLVLLDLYMPRMTGLDAIKEIKRVSPQTKIIVLTAYNTEEYILSCLQAGADGYVLKEDGSTELLTAIRRVLGGHRYLSPRISDTIIDSLTQGKKVSAIRPAWATVSKRERQILKLIAEGYKNREIADLLCISINTVENHRTNLMGKLGRHNVASLTTLAVEKGLVKQ